MKFFLNLLFGLLLFDTIQGSTLPPERQIRGINTTLRTNFNGTYERQNPCSDKEVETSSYIASHELHHHTRGGDWSYYTQKCSAIISNFLQSIGNLIRFNHEPNGSFNFYLNTSISQKQAFSGNKESCNSLPTIIIEATDCKIPVNPSCPTTDISNTNSIAGDKYPIGQFTNKETSPPNVIPGRQDAIPPFGTEQIPQNRFPLADGTISLDSLRQSTPKCPLRAGGEWLEVNKKPGQGDNFLILPPNEFSPTSPLSTPRGGIVETDDFSQAVLNDLSQVTQSTHEPKTKYFKTSLRLTPQTDPESGTVQPRVQFTRTNLLADSTDRVSEFPEQNVALEYPLPTPRRPEPIDQFNQQSPEPISNNQLQFTTPALPFNEFPPRPIPSGNDFVPQSTTPVNSNRNPEFPTVPAQPDLAQPEGENLPMQFGPPQSFDDSQTQDLKQSEMLPGAPQNNYFPDGQIQKQGLNPFLEQRFNENMPNQISGSGPPLVDNLSRHTQDVNGPQYNPSPFNQPPIGDYSLSAQTDIIPPRLPSNFDRSDRSPILSNSQFVAQQTPPFEFQTQQSFDNRFPVTLSPPTDSVVTKTNDVFPTTAAPMFEANGPPEYLATNDNPTTSAGQSDFRGMTTPMPSFPNYDSFVTPFPRFDEETLPSDISVESSDFNLRNSPLDQQLNGGGRPIAPSPTLVNQETSPSNEQIPSQESFPPPPPQVALSDESVIERPNYRPGNPTFFDQTVNNPQPLFSSDDSQNLGVPKPLPNNVNQIQPLTKNQFQSSTPRDGITNELPPKGPKQPPTNVEQGISGNFENFQNPNARFDLFTPTFTPEEFSPSPDAQSFTPEREQEPFSPPAQLPTDRTVPQLYQGNPNSGNMGEVSQGKFGNFPINPTATEPDNFTPFMYTTPRYTTPGYDSQLNSEQTSVPGSVNNNFDGPDSGSGFSENDLTTDSRPPIANPFPERRIPESLNPSFVSTIPNDFSENGDVDVSDVAKQPNQELNFNRPPAFPEFVGPVFPEGQSLEMNQSPRFFPSSPVPNDFSNVNSEQQTLNNIPSDSPMPSQQIPFNDQSFTTPVPVPTPVAPGNQKWDENMKQTTPINVLNDEPSNQPNGQIFDNTNNPSFPVQDMTVPLNPSVQNPAFNPALMSDSQIAEVGKNNGPTGIRDFSSRSEAFGNEPNVPSMPGLDEQMRAQQNPNFQDSLVTPRMPPTPEFLDYTTPQDIQKPEMTQNYNNQPINPVENPEIGAIPAGRGFENPESAPFRPQPQQQVPFGSMPGDNFRRPNSFGNFNGDVTQIPPNALEQIETTASNQELQPRLIDVDPNQNNGIREFTSTDFSSSVEPLNNVDSFQTTTPPNDNIPNQPVVNSGEFPQKPFSNEMSLRDFPQMVTNSPQFVPTTAADSKMTTGSTLFAENDQNILTPDNPQLPFTPAPSQQQVPGLNSGFNSPLPSIKRNPDEDISSTALSTLSPSFPEPETVNQNVTPVPFGNQPNLVPSGESQSPEQGMQETQPINFQQNIPNQFVGDSFTDKSLISPVQGQQFPRRFDYTTTNIQDGFPVSQNRPLTEFQPNNRQPIFNPEFSNDQAPQFNENFIAPQPSNFINQPLLNNPPNQKFSNEPSNIGDQNLPQPITPVEEGSPTEAPFQPSGFPTDDMISETSSPNSPEMSNINNSNPPFYPRQTFNQPNGVPGGNFGPRFFPGNPENNQQFGNSNPGLESKDYLNQPSYNQVPGPMFAPAMTEGPNFINQPLPDSLQRSQFPNNQQPKPIMTDGENSLKTTTTVEEDTTTEVPIQPSKSETFPSANQPDMRNGNYPVQPFDPRQSFNQPGGEPVGNFRGPVLENSENFNRPNFNPGFSNTQGPIFHRNGFAPAQMPESETFVNQPLPQGPIVNEQQQPMIPEGRPLPPPEQNFSQKITVEESTTTESTEQPPKFPIETGATNMKPEHAANIPDVYPNQPFDPRQAFNQPNGEPVGNFEPRFFPGNPENGNQQFANPNLRFPVDNSFNRPDFNPGYPGAQGPIFYNNGDAMRLNDQQIPGSIEGQQPTPALTQVQSLPPPAQNIPQSTTTAEEDATTVTPFPLTTTPTESDVTYDIPPPSNHPNMSNINSPIQQFDPIQTFNRESAGPRFFPENPENHNQQFGNPNLRFPVNNLQNSFNNPNFRPGNDNQQFENQISANNPMDSLITSNFNQEYPNRQESLLYRNGANGEIQIPEGPNSMNQFSPNNLQSPNGQQIIPVTTDDKSTQTETTTEESAITESQFQLPQSEANYPDMRNVNYPVDQRQVFNQPNGGFGDNFRRPVFPVGPGYNGQEVESQNNLPNSFNGFNGNLNNPNVQAPIFYGNGDAPAPGGPNFLNQPLPTIQNPSSPNDQQPVPPITNDQQPIPTVSNDPQLSQTTTTTVVETTTTESPFQQTATPLDSEKSFPTDMKPELLPTNRPDQRNIDYPIQPFDPRQGFMDKPNPEFVGNFGAPGNNNQNVENLNYPQDSTNGTPIPVRVGNVGPRIGNNGEIVNEWSNPMAKSSSPYLDSGNLGKEVDVLGEKEIASDDQIERQPPVAPVNVLPSYPNQRESDFSQMPAPNDVPMPAQRSPAQFAPEGNPLVNPLIEAMQYHMGFPNRQSPFPGPSDLPFDRMNRNQMIPPTSPGDWNPNFVNSQSLQGNTPQDVPNRPQPDPRALVPDQTTPSNGPDPASTGRFDFVASPLRNSFNADRMRS